MFVSSSITFPFKTKEGVLEEFICASTLNGTQHRIAKIKIENAFIFILKGKHTHFKASIKTTLLANSAFL
ncbi:hypothetical protein GCM10008083_32040 [Ulvibacter litoralis]|nr:hypothetical protein GCM10008083_32040 [Ulvibacter litoralis]